MWCCDSAASAWATREIEAAWTLSKALTPIQLCAYPLRGAVLLFQAINLSGNLHHTCDCARKEIKAKKERAERERAEREKAEREPVAEHPLSPDTAYRLRSPERPLRFYLSGS